MKNLLVAILPGRSGTLALSVLLLAAGPMAAAPEPGPVPTAGAATALLSTASVTRFLPVVLDVTGRARYTSELSLTNRGASAATVHLFYTAAATLGGQGSGTVAVPLGAGRQLVLGDAIGFFRTSGLAIPEGSQGGSLRVTFEGLSSAEVASAGVRITAPSENGRAGVAYVAPRVDALPTTATSWLHGLRSSSRDRTNVAFANASTTASTTLRLTLFNGQVSGGGSPQKVVLSDLTLGPGQWHQVDDVFAGTGFEQGYASVSVVSGAGPYFAYAVFNDADTNDGSFAPFEVEPATTGSRLVPVVVETGRYASELILTNTTSQAQTVELSYVESLSPESGAGGVATETLAAGEQKLISSVLDALRPKVTGTIGPAGESYAGTLSARFLSGGSEAAGYAGARTGSPARSGAGFYGLYYGGVAASSRAQAGAWVYGLRHDPAVRANVAAAASPENPAPVSVHVEVYDGATGALAGTTASVSLVPGGWKQWADLLPAYGVTQGYVKVVNETSSGTVVAYGVVNDGPTPGSATGTDDGSYVPGVPDTGPIAGAGAPVLSSIYPATTYAGASAQTMTLVGSGFSSGATVTVNGISRPATVVSETHATAELTTAELATAGTWSVTVTNPAPGGGTSGGRTLTLTSLSFGDTAISTPDWTAATHGKLKADALTANLGKVFDTSQVQRLDITVDAANWAVMQSNLARLKAELGGSVEFSTLDDPIYVPCDVQYDGKHWYKVGLRFKGNSSLFGANSSKLPFKLKFNEFEDVYPAIKNQRFYGFKSLSVKSNFKDESEVHEHVASQLFREFGLASPHTSFYRLYLNTGGGSVYYGLYTLVEEIDDTVIKTQYASDSGNLYKPEDGAATFATGSFDTWELAKKTNEADLDYADVQALHDALNSTLRVTDPVTWKANLERILDVPVFLKWLAANQVMQNWDTYGVMTHNYYLYRSPATRLLEWIPWDNNEALVSHPRCLSLGATEVTSAWPLIRYLLSDAGYAATYRQNVHDFAGTLFNPTRMTPVYTALAALVQEAVLAEVPGSTFTSSSRFASAVSALKSQAAARYAAAMAY